MLIIERYEGNTGIIEDGGKHFEVSRKMHVRETY